MTEEASKERLLGAWRECQRHAHHMNHAIQDLDQFVLRYGKLQDAMGARLLPGVLAYLQEPYEDRPMRDKLNRLEKLGYVEQAEQWQQLRAIRNGFAHEYPDDPEKKAALLNLAREAVSALEAILVRTQQRLELPEA